MIQNACMNAERLWKQGSCCACRFHKFALDLSLSACTLGVPHSNQWSSENSFVRFEARSMINLFAALKWNGIGSTSTCFYLEVLDDENDFSRSLTVRRGGSLEALFLRWERPKTPNPYAARTGNGKTVIARFERCIWNRRALVLLQLGLSTNWHW